MFRFEQPVLITGEWVKYTFPDRARGGVELHLEDFTILYYSFNRGLTYSNTSETITLEGNRSKHNIWLRTGNGAEGSVLVTVKDSGAPTVPLAIESKSIDNKTLTLTFNKPVKLIDGTKGITVRVDGILDTYPVSVTQYGERTVSYLLTDTPIVSALWSYDGSIGEHLDGTSDALMESISVLVHPEPYIVGIDNSFNFTQPNNSQYIGVL